METTFKYNGKIITTPNLEKKLKRMKISITDIEIINTPTLKEKSKFGLEDYMIDKEQVLIKSKLDNIIRICYVDKGTRPSIESIFKNQMWNPKTKTGIKKYTLEFIRTMYYV